MMQVEVIKVTTTGGGGAATGSSDSAEIVDGIIEGIYLDYDANCHANTDVTIATKGSTPPSYQILKVTNAKADGYFAPRAKPVDNTGAAITDAHAPFAVFDYLTVSVADCNALPDAVVVYVIYRRRKHA